MFRCGEDRAGQRGELRVPGVRVRQQQTAHRQVTVKNKY